MGVDRKVVRCISCKLDKPHFGLGYCSSCLRAHKRKTRPSFYLGTCFSEICRRCKTEDLLRPNYFGLQRCSKKEFLDKFLNDTAFLELYKLWQESGFERKEAPSIDRIDNKLGYVTSNLQFISQALNSIKDKKLPVDLFDASNNFIYSFESQLDAANFLGIKPSTVCLHLKGKRKLKDGNRLVRKS